MAIALSAHLLALLLSCLVSLYTIRVVRRRATHNLPPGPKGIPFLGNLFQLSQTPWIEFENWKKDHGPFVYITAVGRRMLVLNTHEAAAGLLERRGHLCDDRSRSIVASEMMCGDMLLPIMRFGERFRRMRRACQELLTKTQVVEYYPIQMREAVILTDDLIQKPGEWRSQFSRTSASTILSVVYDIPPVLSPDDPLVKRVDHFTRSVSIAANPVSHLVEFFPWMRYFPPWMAKWKREAEGTYQSGTDLFEGLLHDVENRIKKGDERPSFAGTIIHGRQRHQLSDLEGAWLAASVYTAGAETAGTVMKWFMLAMIAYPEKQKRCQEELDAIVGRSRMPTFKDRDSLPYICATVRELLRWRPVTPVGVPHYTKEDIWHEGYFVPKDTICMPNVWSINRERTVYGDDADDFNPDRFVTGGRGSLTLANTNHEGHATFGFGPRICPGRHMAANSLFMNIASILWAASISPVEDATGKPIIPNTLDTARGGLVIRPRPFDCLITPRFPEAATVITQTRELL